MLLLDKLIGRWIPVRFLAFSIVGTMGVAVHFAVLTLVFQGLHRGFVEGQAAATLGAMTFNYTVNNVLTYRDMRLRGIRWLRGWASFVLACSVGGFANVGVAAAAFGLVKDVPAAIAGILVGAVWNYAVHHDLDVGRARRDGVEVRAGSLRRGEPPRAARLNGVCAAHAARDLACGGRVERLTGHAHRNAPSSAKVA